MRVPVRIVASEPLLSGMETGVFDQAANVACLPGILDYSWCMPDGHWGYGFPIGGVAGMDPDTGVISPGGIGFDINCGMRLCLTTLTEEEVRPRIHALVDLLFTRIPTGVGCTGFVRCSRGEFRSVAEQGSRWRLRNGFALPEDLEMTEEGGCFEGADASACSDKAIERGFDLIGTLGGGNHYCEIQVARPKNVYDQTTAQAFGITIPNQVVVMLHCGSRGFGHQVATDYLQSFLRVARDLCPHRLLGRRGRGGGFCLQRHRQRGCRHSRGRTEQKGREAGADRQHQGVTMPYRFREDIATADVAFEAWGGYAGEIVHCRRLLHAEAVRIEKQEDIFRLEATVRGEVIEAGRHLLLVDVKAVTLHRLQVEYEDSVWKAVVVLDVVVTQSTAVMF